MDYVVVNAIDGTPVKFYSMYELREFRDQAEDYLRNIRTPFVIRHDTYDELAHDSNHDCHSFRLCQYVLSLGKWAKIADIDEAATRSRNEKYVGICEYMMTLRPEYQKLIANDLERVINDASAALERWQDEIDAQKKAEIDEKNRLLDGVVWQITERNISDEGGRTKEYTHRVTVNGKTYTFIERNVFDFGRVINFEYGGIVILGDDGLLHKEIRQNNHWVQGDLLAGDELRAYMIVDKYGRFAESPIRM